MLSTAIKRRIATALSGAAIAGSVGAPAAPAMPIDPVQAPVEVSDLSTAPSAPSNVETTPDAGLDLSSAAIGAAAGTGLLIVVLAAGGMAWRRPVTRPDSTAGA